MRSKMTIMGTVLGAIGLSAVVLMVTFGPWAGLAVSLGIAAVILLLCERRQQPSPAPRAIPEETARP
jgi:hypothetical protein